MKNAPAFFSVMETICNNLEKYQKKLLKESSIREETMIKLLADSACDLEAEEAKARGIALLPLYIRFGDEEFQDGVTLSHREFFEKLIETDDIPKTSQISEYRFTEGVRRAHKGRQRSCSPSSFLPSFRAPAQAP